MMRIALGWIGALLFGLNGFSGAVAQPRSSLADYWQAVDKSMTDLLQEGYRLVSVIAPSPQLRVYFLSSGVLLAKCTEEARLARLPPPPPQLPPPTQLPSLAQPMPNFDPGDYVPEIESTIACFRLSRSR